MAVMKFKRGAADVSYPLSPIETNFTDIALCALTDNLLLQLEDYSLAADPSVEILIALNGQDFAYYNTSSKKLVITPIAFDFFPCI